MAVVSIRDGTSFRRTCAGCTTRRVTCPSSWTKSYLGPWASSRSTASLEDLMILLNEYLTGTEKTDATCTAVQVNSGWYNPSDYPSDSGTETNLNIQYARAHSVSDPHYLLQGRQRKGDLLIGWLHCKLDQGTSRRRSSQRTVPTRRPSSRTIQRVGAACSRSSECVRPAPSSRAAIQASTEVNAWPGVVPAVFVSSPPQSSSHPGGVALFSPLHDCESKSLTTLRFHRSLCYYSRWHDKPQPRSRTEPLRWRLLELLSSPELPGRRRGNLPPRFRLAV